MNHTARRILTIDIETLPSLQPVEADTRERRSGKDTDAHARTALSGDFGRILCIGFAEEDGSGVVSRGCLGWDGERKKFDGDEDQILTAFWRMLKGFRPSVDRVVGHNLFDFDLKFIYKRSVVHGVKPSVELSFARYRNQPLFDTMCEWERWGYGSKISLDRLARVLNLPSSKSDGVDGSQVSQLFSAGEHEAIYNYCQRDVELTRLIYRRLTFAENITRGADTTGGDAQFAPRELEGRESVVTVY
jgi:DNA polymerase elongation subunit (family B)